MEVGEEGEFTYRYKILPIAIRFCLSPYCHHQNDSCIKVDSDESHFNIS